MSIEPVNPTAPTSAAQRVEASEGPRQGPRVVPLQRTPTSTEELRGALGRAVETVLGQPATPVMLDILTAHSAMETGRGRRMYNYNFAGIKGTGPSGMTAGSPTQEYADGRYVRVQARFRAYASLDEGAADYVSLLQRRYAPALEAAARGDVDGFTHELRARGYFTAPEAEYAASLRSLSGLPASRVAPAQVVSLEGGPFGANSFGSAREVARVLDAVAAGVARIAAPDEDST